MPSNSTLTGRSTLGSCRLHLQASVTANDKAAFRSKMKITQTFVVSIQRGYYEFPRMGLA